MKSLSASVRKVSGIQGPSSDSQFSTSRALCRQAPSDLSHANAAATSNGEKPSEGTPLHFVFVWFKWHKEIAFVLLCTSSSEAAVYKKGRQRMSISHSTFHPWCINV